MEIQKQLKQVSGTNNRKIQYTVHGNIFIADTFNNSVRKIDPTGHVTTTSTFNRPQGICVDSIDNIFVTDANHIYKLTAQ